MLERAGVRAGIGGLALLLLVVGVVAAANEGEDAVDAPAPASSSSSTTTTVASTTTTTAPFAPVEQEQTVALVWAPKGIAAALVDDARAVDPALGRATTVLGDRVMIVRARDASGLLATEAPAGLAVPLDVLAVDPDAHRPFVSVLMQEALHGLGDDEIVLGTSSARVRRIAEGGRLETRDGVTLTVAAVVPDVDVSGAEGVVTVAAAERIGVDTPRFALVAHDDLSVVQRAFREAHPAESPIRVRDAAETRYARHGDGVLTQVEIKLQFGEFAFREGDGVREFAETDQGFIDDNIGSTNLPIIGRTECHRGMLGSLNSALADVAELQDRLQADYRATTTTTTTSSTSSTSTPQPPPDSTTSTTTLADDPDFPVLLEADASLGCFNPRQIGAGGPDAGISRHAWGVAIDLRPPRGAAAHDARVVDIFARWGFVNGAQWLTPDAPHFEWVVPPES